MPELLASTLHLLLFTTHCVCHAEGHDASEAALLPTDAALDSPTTMTLIQAREGRLWAIKLLTLLQTTFDDFDYTPFMPLLFACLSPVLQRLHTHYTQSPAGLLSMLLVMVEQPTTLKLLHFAPPSAPVLPSVYAMLSATSCAKTVSDTVLSIVEALLDHIDSSKKSAAAAAAAVTASGDEQSADAGSEDGMDTEEADSTRTSSVELVAEAEGQAVTAAMAEELLLAHMPRLLEDLHRRLKGKFGGDAVKALAAAGGGDQATRELRLFTRLTGHVKSPEQAEPLLELFLPYLKLKSTPRTERVKEQVGNAPSPTQGRPPLCW